MKTDAYYSVTFGLTGCYLPDSHSGAYSFSTRKELAAIIRDNLKMYEMPASLFKQARIRGKLWPFIKRNGASCAHFSLSHGGYSLSFHGLTEQEYNEQEDAA